MTWWNKDSKIKAEGKNSTKRRINKSDMLTKPLHKGKRMFSQTMHSYADSFLVRT